MTAFSCSQTSDTNTKIEFNTTQLALIQTCIDSTLNLDSALNSTTYLVDFTGVTSLDRQIIDSFLRANPFVIETNLDSLFKHDTKWRSAQYFDNPVIRFEKITYRNDGTILINTSKTKASDGAIGTEIILKQEGKRYECLKSEITWIS